MQCTVNLTQFLKLQVLNGRTCKLQANQSTQTLTLTASMNSGQLTCTQPAQVEQDGGFILDFTNLRRVAGRSTLLTLQLDSPDQLLVTKSKGKPRSIPALSVRYSPFIELIELQSNEFCPSASILYEAIQRCSIAVIEGDHPDFPIWGMNINVLKDVVRYCSLTPQTISVYQEPAPSTNPSFNPGLINWSTILMADTMNLIQAVMPLSQNWNSSSCRVTNKPGWYDVARHSEGLVLQGRTENDIQLQVLVRHKADRFPDYQLYIPQHFDRWIIASKADLVKALESAALLGSVITFHIERISQETNPSSIEIGVHKSNNDFYRKEAEGTITLPIQQASNLPNCPVTCRIEYLMPGVGQYQGDAVTLALWGSHNVIQRIYLVEAESNPNLTLNSFLKWKWLYLVMPIAQPVKPTLLSEIYIQ